MNLEQRLLSAAQELNQSAQRTSPPPLRPASQLMRPWLAFAAALAVVLAVFGIPYALTNFGQETPPNSAPLAGAGSTTTTECLATESTTPPDDRTVDVVELETWPSGIHVIAFLNDENSAGVSPGAHEALLTEVESWDEVAAVSYFDKDDAWIEYQEIFEGQDDLLDIDPAILPATIRVELTDIAFQSEVQSRLEQRTPVVREVNAAPTDVETGVLEDQSTLTTDCITETTVTTLPPTTAVVETTTTPGQECQAAKFYPPTTAGYSDDGSDPRDLTEPVADKVTRIAGAAAACDASALATLASDDITTTYGPGSGPEDIASWQPDDERFEIIGELLNMNREVTEMPDGSRLYVWPAAFAYDTWDEIPAAAMDELLRIYTQEELDQISLLGSYGGWRIGITEAGEWIFFVAGD